MRRVASIAILTVLTVGLTSCVTSPSSAVTSFDPSDMQAWAVEMRSSLNSHREAAGAPPLARCTALDVAAWNHSNEQATRQKMSHTGSNGSDTTQRVESAGYRGWTALGENVAAGQLSVSSVMSGWMGSGGHRDSILNPKFTHVGVGLAISASNTPYWTQVFGAGGSC